MIIFQTFSDGDNLEMACPIYCNVFTVREYDGLFKIALMFDRKKIPNAILSKANLR